ncbi:MAG: DUF6265 family protein [Thermoanaerobaculia bacterium]|nr:DUF6265 family protein [Thermoanaerobaculia bacterium]
MKLRQIAIASVIVLFPLTLLATTASAEEAESSKAPVQATIDDFAWFGGHWLGEENGDETMIEENWGIPHNGLILGMFRQDSPRQTFYELMSLAETDSGSVELRIKHFNPGLVAWEEKDEMVLFELMNVKESHATFVDEKGTRLVYDRDGDLLVVALESDRDGETRRMEFRFRQAPF